MRKGDWLKAVGFGVLLTLAVGGTVLGCSQGLGTPSERIPTLAFLTLALGQLFHVFNMRSAAGTVLGNEVVRNPHVWGAITFCVALSVAAVFIPPVAGVLHLHRLTGNEWGVVALGSLAPLVIGQLILSFVKRST